MPKKKRGSGFFHVKAGKYHDQTGGDGRGITGRRKFTNEVEVGTQSSNNDSPVQDIPAGSNQQAVCHPQLLIDQISRLEKTDQDRHYNTLNLLNSVLPMQWKGILSQQGFHAVRISSSQNIAIQRSVFAPFSDALKVFVHHKDITEELRNELLKGLQMDVSLHDSLNVFVDIVLKVVHAVRSWEICAGLDQDKFQEMWSTDRNGYVDENIFDETRYVKTFRSNKCSLLISLDKWRCIECKKAGTRFRERSKTHQEEAMHPNAKNIYLDEKQKLFKLQSQQKELRKQKGKLTILKIGFDF